MYCNVKSACRGAGRRCPALPPGERYRQSGALCRGLYESFVSRINTNDHEDRPAWMGKVGFADLKLKLIGAIVAVSAVELLKAFLVSQNYTDSQLAWKVGIHFTFVLSGVFFAITDYIAESSKRK
jgi:uncharacterized protein (TIGR00645 family)